MKKEFKKNRISHFFHYLTVAIVFIIIFLAGSYLKPLNLKQYFEGNTLIAAGESFTVNVRFVNEYKLANVDRLALMYSLRDAEDHTVLSGREDLVKNNSYYRTEIFVPEDFREGLYKVDLLVGVEGQEHPAISHTTVKIEKRYFGYFMRNWLRALPFILIPIIIYYIVERRRKNKKTITK